MHRHRTEDVLVDVNITPTPLETSRNMRGGSGSRVLAKVRNKTPSQTLLTQRTS